MRSHMRNFFSKAVLLWAIAAFYAAPAQAEAPTIAFDGKTYALAFVDETLTQNINEYILPGETLETWTKMVALHIYHDKADMTPEQFVMAFADIIKKMNPDATPNLSRNEKKGEAMIEFLTWPPDRAYAELNIFKFKKHNGKLVGFQYASRNYGAITDAFKEELKDEPRLAVLMFDEPFPDFVPKSSQPE